MASPDRPDAGNGAHRNGTRARAPQDPRVEGSATKGRPARTTGVIGDPLLAPSPTARPPRRRTRPAPSAVDPALAAMASVAVADVDDTIADEIIVEAPVVEAPAETPPKRADRSGDPITAPTPVVVVDEPEPGPEPEPEVEPARVEEPEPIVARVAEPAVAAAAAATVIEEVEEPDVDEDDFDDLAAALAAVPESDTAVAEPVARTAPAARATPDPAVVPAPVIVPLPALEPAPAEPRTTTVPKVNRRVRWRARRPRVRKVNRVVRRVDPWTVLKVAVIFWVLAYVIVLVAGVLLWNLASTTGTIQNIEGFIKDLFGLETFTFDGAKIFRASWVLGAVMVVAGTGLTIVLAVLFNLIADLVGGIRVTVLEEEVVLRERPVGSGPPRARG